MLDTDTKRRIDTARDILVGKVPDPKSQVEQITIALIYKFMDDMDAESEELGGKRKFFTGDFARYGWAKLMDRSIGGHEMLGLYGEGIARMPENPGIPPLFRDIFKNAYLPYRDPETLKMFLKVIDEFTYDHSERLGDAFEYLLSVLGSQGDAGQFRTPRHIIHFMVAVIDPKKTETVLDPACGTAGFLISAYKHILKTATESTKDIKESASVNSVLFVANNLTPDEKGRLARNFKGYDISPDMVRLSLVNMYLHGFTDPHIAEYDTLTSQDKWNEYADVILANPPFMSPKGGIRPHKRFSVQSKRSEVLFVDYMAEHLTPGGRAAIIVPEGVIFQSQNACKQLRKMLVDEYLVAVVSLPAGVFNPYSGVKTSILILDKSLARRTSTIAFFKVENDGFGLGAQRREIDKNDLPQARAEIAEYLRRLRSREPVDDFTPTLGLVVPKEKLAANGDYNLSGERYREGAVAVSAWPFVTVGDVFRKADETVLPELLSGPVTYLGLENITQKTGEIDGAVVTEKPADIKSLKNVFKPRDILYGKLRPNLNKVWLADRKGICSTDIFVIEAIEGTTDPALYAYLFRSARFNNAVMGQLKGAQLPRIGWSSFADLQIPLPPLEVQKEIVAQIEAYQKVINGARAVLDNYRPHINRNARPLDVKTVVLAALHKFKQRDAYLLEVDGNERAMTAKIACYLQDQYPGWNVDHEYNREGRDVKRASDGHATQPDIIVHRRGSNQNYIVIEAKKQKRSERDCKKLLDFVEKHGYEYAFLLTLDPAKDPEQWLETVCMPELASTEVTEEWPMVKLGDIADVKLGKMLDQVKHQKGAVLPYVRNISVRWGTIDTHDLPEMYFEEDELGRFGLRAGDVLVCEGGEPGRAAVWDGRIPNLKYQKALHRVRFSVPFEPSMLVYLLQEMALSGALVGWLSGTTIKHLTLESFNKLSIPLPPLATQRAIVAEIEAEQALVAANRELIARFERKIQATLARVWGHST
jgi:type I restriction enzyme M protein